jgi:hypothetical protein
MNIILIYNIHVLIGAALVSTDILRHRLQVECTPYVQKIITGNRTQLAFA